MAKWKIVIVGAGDHARVVLEAMTAQPDLFDVVGFVDTHPPAETVMGFPVHGDARLPELRAQGVGAAVIAVGSNAVRQQLGDQVRALGFELPRVVHPSACISPSARLGEGAMVMARAIVGTMACVEDLVIVNSGAIIEHDNQIGSSSHIAPGATLAGSVRVGKRVLVGAGSTVRPRITIGDDAVVGAGAVVVADVAGGVTVTGVPARVRQPKTT